MHKAAAAGVQGTSRVADSKPDSAVMELWQAVQNRVRWSVEECNAVAGERLWRIFNVEANSLSLTVQSTVRASDSVQLEFLPELRKVRCAFGEALGNEVRHFDLVASLSASRAGSPAWNTEEVVISILDALVFPCEA